MNDLFRDNIFFVYLFVCISILNYNYFRETQKLILIYIVTFGICFLDIVGAYTALILLLLMVFLVSQYLTDDSGKLKIITCFRYKLLDFMFMSVFQYEILPAALAVLLNSDVARRCLGDSFWLARYASVIIIFVTVHRLSAQKFKIKPIKDMMSVFEKNPINSFPQDKLSPLFYDILISLEDKSFFARAESYNFVSAEFIRYKFGRLTRARLTRVRQAVPQLKKYLRINRLIRGYSTIEMQLMRNIGLERGYTCIIRRKIFELIYTKIFFASLKNYYKVNYYANINYYKEYLIYIYYHVVETKINGRRFARFRDAFADKNAATWSKEGLLIACAGLSHKWVTSNNVDLLFAEIITRYDLDTQRIFAMAENIDNSLLT